MTTQLDSGGRRPDRVSPWLRDLRTWSIVGDALEETGSRLLATLEGFDSWEMARLRALDADLIRAVTLARRNQDWPALAALWRDVAFDRSDPYLLIALLREGLGADPGHAHRWLLDHDVSGQRRRFLRQEVLPLAARRGWTLFAALKRLEFRRTGDDAAFSAAMHEAVMAVADDEAALEPEERSAGARRLEMPDPAFQAALHLSRTAPEALRAIAETSLPTSFLRACGRHAAAPTYLVVSTLSYPMGGGESYMHQTCRTLTEFGIRCVWLSFRDAQTGPHATDKLVPTPFYLDHRSSAQLSRTTVEAAIARYRPSLLHTHGEPNDIVTDLAASHGIRALVGQHFWPGLVQLGPTDNTRILENIAQHRPCAPAAAPSSLVTRYVASEFMEEVYRRVGGTEALSVLHPLSDAAEFLVAGAREPHVALCLNVSPHKGGGIFLDCVAALGDRIPFVGVISEPGDTAFLDRLRATCAAYPACELHGYGDVRELYRRARLVLVPTLVDETFCRVAYEAAMNGIPVLTTRNGYIPTLLGETGIYLSEDPQSWIDAIASLFDEGAKLAGIGQAQQAFVRAKFGGSASAFLELALGLISTTVRGELGAA